MNDVVITGVADVMKEINSYADIATYEAAMDQLSLWMESKVKKNIVDNDSVVTGEMLRNISSESYTEGTTIVAECYSPTEYAPYVEYGTIHAGAKPFMRPVLDDTDAIVNFLKKKIDKINRNT